MNQINRMALIAGGVVALLSLSQCEKDQALPPEQENIPPEWTYDPTPYNVEVPLLFPQVEAAVGNPLTQEGVQLGRMLYYDPVLHPDSAMACASCHLQSRAFSFPGAVMAHINLGWCENYLWDGKIRGTPEDIMLFEVEEFFGTDVSKLNNHPFYPRLFYEAFGIHTITTEYAAKAMAQFFRTLISSDSKYDQVMRNEGGAELTEAELRGYEIFYTEKGDCFHCHGDPFFTDYQFHNNGLDSAFPRLGLGEITGDPLDEGKFRTPTLRNLTFTAPYMHDGRFQTLEEVIDFYSEELQPSATIDPLMKNVHRGGIQLTQQEKADLIAFLQTLNDSTFITNPDLAKPDFTAFQ